MAALMRAPPLCGYRPFLPAFSHCGPSQGGFSLRLDGAGANPFRAQQIAGILRGIAIVVLN